MHIPTRLAPLALVAALAACAAPGQHPAPRTAAGSDAAPFEQVANSHAAAVFERGANCGPDCVEALARSGRDYDARKKETLIGRPAGGAK